VQVRCTEGLASHSSPESCAGTREGVGEALTGVRTGQPLSRERVLFPGAHTVVNVEGNTKGRATASALTARRGRRTWHVWTLFVREPGDLGTDRQGSVGPHREGEEP
jgi:hypothetical protein